MLTDPLVTKRVPSNEIFPDGLPKKTKRLRWRSGQQTIVRLTREENTITCRD